MNQALWVAKTGLDAQQSRLTVISNNLANISDDIAKLNEISDLLLQIKSAWEQIPGPSQNAGR